MTKVIPKPALRGSQKWLQVAINEKSSFLNTLILKQLPKSNDQTIMWLSPIKSDEYAEYRDADFLERLNIELPNRSLVSFWPRHGPQWDGLGKTQDGAVLLIEAKAHIPEIRSPATQASEKSQELIQESLKEVKSFLGVQSKVDWSGTYYQYTNRIAHLYFLREINKLPAYLVFVNFINDKEMNGPTHEDEWHTAIHDLEAHLGLPAQHKLSQYILHVYLDISLLQ
ncbi:MAG: hypothetical protein ABI904_06935 [Chloroflexota bacterium]